MGFIFFLSSAPRSELFDPVNWEYFGIKSLHLVEYGILGALFYIAISKTTKLSKSIAIPLSALLCGLYGITDEIHQAFVPGRSARAMDVLADVVGGLLGAAFLFYWAKIFGRRAERA